MLEFPFKDSFIVPKQVVAAWRTGEGHSEGIVLFEYFFYSQESWV